jgi:EAL domain-containing protein (putative c-di-GMP-specific phosphodiesterase class I)
MALASTKPPPGENQRPASGPALKATSVRDLTTSDLDVVFQPIVDLQTGFTFAYEALTRCKWPEFKNPLVLFQQAEAERACGPLVQSLRGRAAVRQPTPARAERRLAGAPR